MPHGKTMGSATQSFAEDSASEACGVPSATERRIRQCWTIETGARRAGARISSTDHAGLRLSEGSAKGCECRSFFQLARSAQLATTPAVGRTSWRRATPSDRAARVACYAHRQWGQCAGRCYRVVESLRASATAHGKLLTKARVVLPDVAARWHRLLTLPSTGTCVPQVRRNGVAH